MDVFVWGKTYGGDGRANAAYGEHPEQVSCFVGIFHGLEDVLGDESAYVSQQGGLLVSWLRAEAEH